MPEIQKISVALTREQVSQLKAVVDSGEYATTSEVIREAVREWQWKREVRMDEREHLRKLWDEGIASGMAGTPDFEAARTEARRRLRKVRKQSA